MGWSERKHSERMTPREPPRTRSTARVDLVRGGSRGVRYQKALQRRIALLVPQILTYPNDYRASIFVLRSRESQRNGTHDTACTSLPKHILTYKKPDWLQGITATKGA